MSAKRRTGFVTVDVDVDIDEVLDEISDDDIRDEYNDRFGQLGRGLRLDRAGRRNRAPPL